MRSTTLAPELSKVLDAGKSVIVERRYDCIGCDPCFPADALNIAGELVELPAGAGCEAKPVVARDGWPPLPGDYEVIRTNAPVAVVALDSDDVRNGLSAQAPDGLAIVGTMRTENLGIERVLTNLAANPNIACVIVCGRDTEAVVGHFPGQSLLALHASGVDERGRIVGAKGKRPVLKNVSPSVVDHFRRSVRIVDRIGVSDVDVLCELVSSEARSSENASLAATTPVQSVSAVSVIEARAAEKLKLDPAGYLIVYVDDARASLVVEHYANNGTLAHVVRGATGRDLLSTIVERGLVSRLDHAGYVGRELERAESAMRRGERYVQDRAPGALTDVDAEANAEADCGCHGGSKC